MLFITNKIIKPSGKHFTFEDSNELSPSLKYCQMVTQKTFREITSKPFMEALMNAKEQEILFYIHGFNNQPYEDVLPRARAIQTQLKAASLSRVQVVPIIWPCDDDFGVIKDYWDDQDSAEQTGVIFARTIAKLMAWQEENAANPCMKRMHVLAHSMGGRVLLQCLFNFARKNGGGGVPFLFKNVFLMAADIPNESLESSEPGVHITQAAQRVLCYYANDDFAMPASKVSNVRNMVFSRRIGHTGPEDMTKVADNVYAVNCDAFNNKFDSPKGHSYFLDKGDQKSPAFQHMVKAIRAKKQDLGGRRITL